MDLQGGFLPWVELVLAISRAVDKSIFDFSQHGDGFLGDAFSPHKWKLQMS
jgi:hypothetical protein